MKYLILVAICLLAGCGSASAPVKKTAPTIIPQSHNYPPLVDQNGNIVTNDPYGLPPAPPM
jgi:uncharacterized lipoprotein YajG